MSAHDGAALAYIEVKAEAVPSTSRRAAHAALLLACQLMPYLPPTLTVRWFTRATGAVQEGDVALAELGRLLHAVGEDDPRGGGFYSDNRLVGRAYSAESHTLWVAAHLSARETAITTLHEARHQAQFLVWPPASYGPLTDARRAAMETDAEAWATAHIGEVDVRG